MAKVTGAQVLSRSFCLGALKAVKYTRHKSKWENEIRGVSFVKLLSLLSINFLGMVDTNTVGLM